MLPVLGYLLPDSAVDPRPRSSDLFMPPALITFQDRRSRFSTSKGPPGRAQLHNLQRTLRSTLSDIMAQVNASGHAVYTPSRQSRSGRFSGEKRIPGWTGTIGARTYEQDVGKLTRIVLAIRVVHGRSNQQPTEAVTYGVEFISFRVNPGPVRPPPRLLPWIMPRQNGY